MIRKKYNFSSLIQMCADEATFGNNGRVNGHNLPYWSDRNPYWMREMTLFSLYLEKERRFHHAVLTSIPVFYVLS